MSDTDVLEEEQTTEDTRPDESNFDLEAVAAVLREDTEGRLRRAYDRQVSNTTATIAEGEDSLRYYTGIIRDLNESLGRQRAALRELNENPPVVTDGETIARDIRRMRSFNGVIGLRVDPYGRIVAHIHTSVIYKNRRYHMGDYEVALGESRNYGVLDIICTRSGQRFHTEETRCQEGCCTYRPGYTSHFYWSPSNGNREGGTGEGSFCFGTRAGEIRNLRDQGRWAELLHLVLATMCSVNNGDLRGLERTYQSERCGPKKVSRLRRAGAAIIGTNREE